MLRRGRCVEAMLNSVVMCWQFGTGRGASFRCTGTADVGTFSFSSDGSAYVTVVLLGYLVTRGPVWVFCFDFGRAGVGGRLMGELRDFVL